MEPKPIGALIKTAVNLELAKAESKLSGTIEEQKFAVAIADKSIGDAGEDELKDTLKYVYLLIGLRPQNFPSGGEKEFLHRYIAQNFGGHKLAEVRLAFDMAVQGKLGLDHKDVNCYENFSILYFSRIMTAFREFSREQYKALEYRREPPPTPMPTIYDLACWKLDAIRLSILHEQPKLKPLLTIKQFYERLKENRAMDAERLEKARRRDE